MARLHSCQLLHRLHRHDLAIKLGASLLVDLLRARSAHAHGPEPGAGAGAQILRIAEADAGRAGQASAPLFLDLLCHAGLTVAMALHRKAADCLHAEAAAVTDTSGAQRTRTFAVDADGAAALLFRKAEAITRAVGRQMAAEPSKVSLELAQCAEQYSALLERERPRFGAAISSAALRRSLLLCFWLSAARELRNPRPRTRLPPARDAGAPSPAHGRSPSRRPASRSGVRGSRSFDSSPLRSSVRGERGPGSPGPPVDLQHRYTKNVHLACIFSYIPHTL